jgi:hypothetical protein
VLRAGNADPAGVGSWQRDEFNLHLCCQSSPSGSRNPNPPAICRSASPTTASISPGPTEGRLRLGTSGAMSRGLVRRAC